MKSPPPGLPEHHADHLVPMSLLRKGTPWAVASLYVGCMMQWSGSQTSWRTPFQHGDHRPATSICRWDNGTRVTCNYQLMLVNGLKQSLQRKPQSQEASHMNFPHTKGRLTPILPNLF